MRILKHLPCLAAITLFYACEHSRPAVYTDTREQQTSSEPIVRSLFDPATGLLTEDDAQRLLNGRVILPDSARIAIFRFDRNKGSRYGSYGYWYSDEDHLKTQQSYMDTLVNKCWASRRVAQVITMPSMMTTANPSLVELRTAAVRMQAHLLLVFQLNSDLYYKYRMFARDDAKAFATCEAVLMDVRTGIIPHSSVITEEYLTQKSTEDLTIEETRKRAERGAVKRALGRTGDALVGFLRQK